VKKVYVDINRDYAIINITFIYNRVSSAKKSLNYKLSKCILINLYITLMSCDKNVKYKLRRRVIYVN